jgi:hypothetical protein
MLLEQIPIRNPSKRQEERSGVYFKTRDSWQITTAVFVYVAEDKVTLETLNPLVAALYREARQWRRVT